MDTKNSDYNDEDFINNEDNIRACCDAIETLEFYDVGLMGPEMKSRVEKMKEKIFDILEFSINNLHDETFGNIETN